MLQLENSSCITLAVHEKKATEIAGHVFWHCRSGFDGSGSERGEGACCGCVPRPAIAVVQCTSSSFCEPSKWNVKLNGNNFDWIFLCTIRLTKSRWKYKSKGSVRLAAYPVVSWGVLVEEKFEFINENKNVDKSKWLSTSLNFTMCISRYFSLILCWFVTFTLSLALCTVQHAFLALFRGYPNCALWSISALRLQVAATCGNRKYAVSVR